MYYGIDLDDTIADTIGTMRMLISDVLGRELEEAAEGEDSFHSWRVSEQEKRLFKTEYPDFAQIIPRIEPVAYAIQYIDRLASSKAQNHIYIITGRGSRVDIYSERLATVAWLDKYAIPYEGVIFTEKKGEVCKQLGIDVMIEDNPGYMQDIYDTAHWTNILVRERVHNQKFIEKYRDDFRIRKFKSFYEFLVK